MNSTSLRRGSSSPSWARIVNVILGFWLFLSAFAWPHTAAQMTNTWILGVLEVVFALIAIFSVAKTRYLNTILALWLFITAFAFAGPNAETIWNNVVVAVLTFVFSLVPNAGEPHDRLGHTAI